jgi:hypothetical protein
MTENCRVKIARLREEMRLVPLFLARSRRDLGHLNLLATQDVAERVLRRCRRSPLTIWPLRVRPTHAYVVI